MDLSWLMNNKEWLFSGVGVTGIAILYSVFFGNKKSFPIETDNTNTNTTNVTIAPLQIAPPTIDTAIDSEIVKSKVGILFIDDDLKFRVVKILNRAGWTNTKIVKDLIAIDQQEVKDADIIFVDIQGVGINLAFRDEGLGLTIALKKKFPEKAVIIYSAEQNGDRFHDAIRIADSLLAKNSEPYEFEVIIEKHARIINERR